MKAIARAKINLMLRVTGIREDGYHEIESIAQSLELHDALDFTPSEVTKVSFGGIPVHMDRPELVAEAIDEYNRAAGTELAFTVAVNKSIPPQTGLGGGSADAAAALLVCDETAMASIGGQDLLAIASAVGADVPFCLRGGTAGLRGTGEEMTAMPSPILDWVVCVPLRGLSTAEVYARLDAMGAGSGPMGPETWDEWSSALARSDVESIAGMLHNDLAAPALEMMPELEGVLDAMRSAGALGSVMTGSGSAVCGLCIDAGHAQQVARALGGSFGKVIVTRSTSLGAEVIGG